MRKVNFFVFALIAVLAVSLYIGSGLSYAGSDESVASCCLKHADGGKDCGQAKADCCAAGCCKDGACKTDCCKDGKCACKDCKCSDCKCGKSVAAK